MKLRFECFVFISILGMAINASAYDKHIISTIRQSQVIVEGRVIDVAQYKDSYGVPIEVSRFHILKSIRGLSAGDTIELKVDISAVSEGPTPTPSSFQSSFSLTPL